VHRMLRAALAVAAVAALSGCTGQAEPEPDPAPSASASPTPSDAPDPTLVAGGTADENLPYFDFVNSRFLAGNATPGGRAIVDNLVASGFDKAAMQVTPDETTLGSAVDAVTFSVQIGDRCLVGQAAPSGYVGAVGPVVEGTGCLIGITRAIDW